MTLVTGMATMRIGTEGASVTEFALIAPVFFMLLLAIIEGGRLFSSWLVITNEAREGARYGVVAVGDPAREPTLVSDVRAYVLDRMSGVLETDPSRTNVVVQLDGLPPQVGVTITYSMEIAIPLIQGLLPNPVVLQARSVMRAEE